MHLLKFAGKKRKKLDALFQQNYISNGNNTGGVVETTTRRSKFLQYWLKLSKDKQNNFQVDKKFNHPLQKKEKRYAVTIAPGLMRFYD